MSEEEKSPISLEIESDDSSEYELEVHLNIETLLPTSTTQTEESLVDNQTTPKTIDHSNKETNSPPELASSVPGLRCRQCQREFQGSDCEYLCQQCLEDSARIASESQQSEGATHQISHLLTDRPTTESLRPTSRSETKSKSPIQLHIDSDESSPEIEAGIPSFAPETVLVSNPEDCTGLHEDTDTTPKAVTGSSDLATSPPSSDVTSPELGLALPTDSTTTNPNPPTSGNEPPRPLEQDNEGMDYSLIHQVRNLGLGAETASPSNKDNKDQSRELPFPVRKTGLPTVWSAPDDDDLMPTLGIPQRHDDGTFSGLRCQQCQRSFERSPCEFLCQHCLDVAIRRSSESQGAIGGATSASQQSEGACAAPELYEGPLTYEDFKATYERKTSVEEYIRMRHRQREGIPPPNRLTQGSTAAVPPQRYEETSSDYGYYERSCSRDYERSDSSEYERSDSLDYERRDSSEDEYRRMHYLQRELLGALPSSQESRFDKMRLAELEIFAAMNRPGETFEDVRNPEQELREIEHYDRAMANFAARFGEPTVNTPWKPQEFLDQETLYKLWRPPPHNPPGKDELDRLSPESRKRYELGRMALLRQPKERAEEVLGQPDPGTSSEEDSKEKSKDGSGDDTENSEGSAPSGSSVSTS